MKMAIIPNHFCERRAVIERGKLHSDIVLLFSVPGMDRSADTIKTGGRKIEGNGRYEYPPSVQLLMGNEIIGKVNYCLNVRPFSSLMRETIRSSSRIQSDPHSFHGHQERIASPTRKRYRNKYISLTFRSTQMIRLPCCSTKRPPETTRRSSNTEETTLLQCDDDTETTPT